MRFEAIETVLREFELSIYLYISSFFFTTWYKKNSAWYAVARSKTKTTTTISLDFSRDRLPPRPHLLWVGSGTLDLYKLRGKT